MKFTDLPKDCEEAYKNGYKTGEVMIWPTATIKPFFVYCDMELVPNHGMCIAVFWFSPLLDKFISKFCKEEKLQYQF